MDIEFALDALSDDRFAEVMAGVEFFAARMQAPTPPPKPARVRWTCDDDCGRTHPTYEAALKHAEKRGSVPVRVRS